MAKKCATAVVAEALEAEEIASMNPSEGSQQKKKNGTQKKKALRKLMKKKGFPTCWPCLECANKPKYTKSKLADHYTGVHCDSKEYLRNLCSFCNNSFKTEVDLLDHQA